MIDPFWTPREDERLASLLAAGKTLDEIARIMPGRTLYAVRARKHLLGLKSIRSRPDEWPDERNELLRQLWVVERLSAGDIAERMPGVTRNAVIGKVHRLGLAKPKLAKPRVERRPSRPRNMIRFGNVSIPKSFIPGQAKLVPAKPPAPQRAIGKPVTLLERRFDQCGWPVNDGNPYLFCAAPAEGRYCKHHTAMGVAKRRAA